MEEKLFNPVKTLEMPETKQYDARAYIEQSFKKELKYKKFMKK